MRHRIGWARALGALVFASAAVAGAAACSDSDDRPTFGADAEADTSVGHPDAGAPSDRDADAGGEDRFDAATEPVQCAVEPCVVELAAGARHVCARMAGGDVRCWGDNDRGAAGNGPSPDAGKVDPEDTSRPVIVTDLSGATQISAALDTTCARRQDGAVLCWGGNSFGQLGLEVERPLADELAHPYAAAAAVTGSATRVDVGQKSVCALLASGELVCWGSNERKQLARPEPDRVLGPGASDLAGFEVTRSAASEVTTYGLTSDGALLSWGALGGRQGSLDPDPVPARVPTLESVHDVAVGPTHACAIARGSVHCWGSSRHYALCTGLPSNETLPAHALIQSTAYPQQVSVSRNSTCVRLTDGTLQCCGDASYGQLGVPLVDGGTDVFSFTRVTGFTGYAVQVVTTDISTCALLRTGAVECWGGNEHGELGQGTRDSDPHPTPSKVTF